MAVTAKLTIRLLAEEVTVAESVDPLLWQDVLAAVNSGAARLNRDAVPAGGERDSSTHDEKSGKGGAPAPRTPAKGGGGHAAFAHELGVTLDELDGALSPSTDAPYLALDSHCWEAFKKNTAPRGKGAVPAIAFAATALALWFRHAGIPGNPTPKQCQEVLATIHVEDKNPTRGVRNSDWLKANAGTIAINAANRTKATRIVAAFCKKVPMANPD